MEKPLRPIVKLKKKSCRLALAGVALGIECQLAKGKVASSIPSQGTCLGCRPHPWPRLVGGVQPMFLLYINISLPFTLPFPLSKK